MVDERRRDAIKVTLGVAAAVCAGALATPLVGALVGGKTNFFVSDTYGAIPVEICKSVDECPAEYGVPISQLENGPVFKLIQKGTLAIPAVFGLVSATDGNKYPAAYVPTCTHFGCPVNAAGAPYLTGFYCPCHGSVFTICTDPKGCPQFNAEFLEAYVSGGPAVRPLRAIKVGVKDGVVYPLVAYI